MMAPFENFIARQEVREEEERRKHPEATLLKLRWRALALKHLFHVVPGERILEIGAGTGAFCEAMSAQLRGENPITGAVFSGQLLDQAKARGISNAAFVTAEELTATGGSGSFDYIVGSSVLWQSQMPELLAFLRGLLKPGGQVLFFESNLNFPGARLWNGLKSPMGNRFRGSSERVLHAFSHQGFIQVDVNPYDLLPVAFGARALRLLQAKFLPFEHAPLLKSFCTRMYVSARLPGPPRRDLPNLAEHDSLKDSVSVVIPCRNEAPNLPRLVERLLQCYGPYIHEIVLVNDNSTDDTAAVGERLAQADDRIQVVNRSMPGGVGRALADGYRAASGRYILSMDCDFVEIVPDFRGLFDAIAAGYDGAIGSRFSRDSVLLNYPFGKMICNRALHLLVKIFLRDVRDVTNNLKLYRSDILKNLKIDSPHFSANLETGLKPMLAGYRIKEVASSWIDRTVDMGSSSFNVRKVGVDYARVLWHIWKTKQTCRSAWFTIDLPKEAKSRA